MPNRNSVHPTGRLVAAVFSGIVLTCAFSPSAIAQPQAAPAKTAKAPTAKERATARKHYEAGRKKFDAKDYSGALNEYQLANETISSPQAMEKIALCYDEMKEVAKAIEAYEKFLQASEGNAKLQEARVQAQSRIEELTKMPVEITLTTEPVSAQLSVDGNTQPINSPFRLELAPGKHVIEISAPGYDSAQQQIEIAPGDAPKQLTFTLNQTPEPVVAPVAPAPVVPSTPPPPPPVEPEPVTPETQKRSNVPAYITLGVAGAGAIVGTVFGVKALKSKSNYDDKPNSSDADDAERNAIISDMAFGVAITMGITGTVLLLTNRDNKTETTKPVSTTTRKPTLVVSPYLGRSSGGAAATLTF